MGVPERLPSTRGSCRPFSMKFGQAPPACPPPQHIALALPRLFRVVRHRKELQAAANENAAWASSYVDYKALKQILAQLTPETESQTEGNAQVRAATAPPSRMPLP